MGLNGSGGGILGVGNSFTGPAQALEMAGDHCYAYSGPFEAAATTQTMFNFTSPGSGYIVATLTMTAPVKMADLGDGRLRGYQLDFNSQTVGLYKVESGNEDMPTMIEAQILIPPFTAVVLTCIDNNNSDFIGTANITGRIYRG